MRTSATSSAHTCAGAPLARVEVRVILEKFLEHTSHIDIDDAAHGPKGTRDLDYEPSFIIRGLSELHVKLTPSSDFKLIEAEAIDQIESFEAGVLFARTEGIIPAPEANHGIASAVREAQRAKEEGVSRTILFNLCGHGHFDLGAYEAYFAGRLQRHEMTQAEIDAAVAQIDTPMIPA